MKGRWIFSNAFSTANEMIMCFFEIVYIVDYVDGFPYIEPSLHAWDEAFFIMMDGCFEVFLGSVVENLLHIFTLIFIREIGLKFSFFAVSLCGLVIQVIVAS